MLTRETRKINPYIVGRPIHEPELFFGRRRIFRVIEDNLKQNVQAILLHGQRRIGKSSVLRQIPNFVGLDEFIFIYFDLHDKTRLSLDELLQNLAATIVNELNFTKPIAVSFELNYQKFFSDEFLPQLIETLDKKQQKMVWLLDEFDVLNELKNDSPTESFFPYLQTLLERNKNLFIIPVVGRRVEDLTNLKSLFKQAPNQEIGLLETSEATALITEPAANYLSYDSEAIQAILDLSSGHPYFTQVVCNNLFPQAEAEEKLEITRDDVIKIIDDAIEIAEGGLTWFRDGLPIPERVVLSAVAQVEKIAKKQTNSVIEEPLRLLREYGVVLTEVLVKAPENLVQWGFLEKLDNEESHYKIKVKLVSYWLVKRYPLRQAIWDLENVDLDANELFELAQRICQYHNLYFSDLYEPVLKLNPNHFKALFKLAEGYLDTKNYKEALEKYGRAYKIDPTLAYEGYALTQRHKYRVKLDNWWVSIIPLGIFWLITVLFIANQPKELAQQKELEAIVAVAESLENKLLNQMMPTPWEETKINIQIGRAHV